MASQAKPALTALMIMPVHSDPAYQAKIDVILDVARGAGWRMEVPQYTVERQDFDAAQARERLSSVSLVVADLSRERPSCYFELGFAEALGKPVRLLAEAGSEIHQSSHRDDVLFYAGLSALRAAMARILAEAGASSRP